MMIQSPINGLTSDRPLSDSDRVPLQGSTVPYWKRPLTDGNRLWIDRKDRLNRPINGYSDV